MSDTLSPCEVNTEGRGNDGAGKCDTKDGEDTSLQNPSTNGIASITDVVLEEKIEEEKIGDVRKVGEDDGEASDETSSSRRESNSSMDGSEDVDVQLNDNNDQDTTNTNTPELNTQPTIKKKKKRRSRHSSRSHNRSVSRHASSPDFTTPSYPITTTTTTTTTSIPNIPNPTIPATLTTQQQNNQQQDTSGSGNKDTINFHSPTSLSKSTSEPLPITSEQTTTTTSTPSSSDTKPFPPIHHSFHQHTRLSTSMTASSPNLPTFDDLSHIPQHLLDLTPPPTRGRSNAFYGTKAVPPLIHSHSDGAAIVAAQNNNINNNNYNPASPNRRNTVGLTYAVPSMPEPSHSGISKPKMFNYWRNLSGPPSYEKAVLSHSKRFLVGFAETIGRRPSMEDCMVVHGAFRGRGHEDYFALFDGHGGRDAAAFAASHLHQILADKLKTNNAVKSLKEAFADTHRMISEQKIIGGTTAVVALFIGKKGFIANVGDTRAVLCRDGVPLRVSLDHKPELPAEMSRIRQLGGTVTTTYNSAGQATSRVNGMLAVSRALGDCVLHPYVSHEPEIHGPLNLDTESRDQFVVLACDGVWDVLTDEEATSIVAPIANPEIASRRLRDEAFARGSTDNISVMVIRCPPFLPCD